MAPLVNGKWQDTWFDTKSSGGSFVRADSTFRNWVTKDNGAKFKPDANRYHLYVSLACPWAHRTLIVRQLKKLQDVISVSVVHPHMGSEGWTFDNPDNTPGCTTDTVNGCQFLHQLYTRADAEFTGRVTVPILWDKELGTIVNNESADIMRILNVEFNDIAGSAVDLYPEELRTEIDAINQPIYEHINNGVYRCGFATSQAAYDEAFESLFATLDKIEIRLADRTTLVGNQITEADWRLFTTLVRFDAVYVGHFKCNRQPLSDFPHLSRYLADLHAVPGIKETVNFEHIKRHYYESHPKLNPSGVVPRGPVLKFAT